MGKTSHDEQKLKQFMTTEITSGRSSSQSYTKKRILKVAVKIWEK
jgi:hypothetical protein